MNIRESIPSSPFPLSPGKPYANLSRKDRCNMFLTESTAEAAVIASCVPRVPEQGITLRQATLTAEIIRFSEDWFRTGISRHSIYRLLRRHLRAQNLRPRPGTYGRLQRIPADIAFSCGFSPNVPEEWLLIFAGVMSFNPEPTDPAQFFNELSMSLTKDPSDVITIRQWFRIVDVYRWRNNGMPLNPLFETKLLPLSLKYIGEASKRPDWYFLEYDIFAMTTRNVMDNLSKLPCWRRLLGEYEKGVDSTLPEGHAKLIEVILSNQI